MERSENLRTSFSTTPVGFRKNLAAKVEYNDSSTNEERKQLLLARYAAFIVDEPDMKYQMIAKEVSKVHVGVYVTVAIVALVLAGFSQVLVFFAKLVLNLF